MQKTTSLFFVLLYLMAMLRPVQPYVDYILNQDYIAQFLCINKDKPKLQCHGKCHLAKQIQKQQEKEPSESLSVSLENYPIGFVNVLSIPKRKTSFSSKQNLHTNYHLLYRYIYNSNPFQPPEYA